MDDRGGEAQPVDPVEGRGSTGDGRAAGDGGGRRALPGGSGPAPRPLHLVERDDAPLPVRERPPGRPLDSWVAARLSTDGTPGVPWAEARPMALALLDLVERAHAAGLVLRDLAPDRVIVLPGGRPILVDLAALRPAGTDARPGEDRDSCPGYRAPEQAPTSIVGRRYGSCPAEPEGDRYALGGLFFLLATGHHPQLPEDLPRARPVHAWPNLARPTRSAGQALGRWLSLAARDGLTARRLAPAVLGLRAERPQQRWQPARVREALGPPAADPTTDRPTDRPTAPPVERVLHDGLRHLAESITPHRPDRLWPDLPAGPALAVLVRAAVTTGLPPELRASAARTARTAADWLARRCAAGGIPALLDGSDLRALRDAADVLDDPGLAARADRLAGRLPLPCRRPDRPDGGAARDGCGSAAAVGLRELRRWRATADRAALDRAHAAGLTLLGRPDACGCHGPADDGAFLLDLAEATGEARFRSGAEHAARQLAAGATLRDGHLLIPPLPEAPAHIAHPLAFLLRLRHATPLPRTPAAAG
ncbi:protein kinase family protein [Kitasatospora mediocidica]|uniref:hypothetical protein n=1 Tax=Kitasatospora mediocidica TaxID=58352 RepID=UPI000563FAFB|nr:hypothetical protein [Kitasatospora mediocidica]